MSKRMKNPQKPRRLVYLALISVVAGCADSSGMFGNNAAYGLGSGTNTTTGGMQSAVLSAIIQSMAGSVLNGQIGSQLAPTDQSFRLQQLSGLLQSGSVNQAQQWLNPQTGNTIAVKPVGQQIVNPQTRQRCINMEETLILQNGKRVPENRRACLNAKTGKWNLVQ